MKAINLLSTQECQQIRTTVFALQRFWEHRQPSIPFYTLGAASYLDAKSEYLKYLDKARTYNQILIEHLGWFYHKLAEYLSTYLNAPIAYPDHLALPGFHIYQACKLFEQPIASIHFDLQYQLIDWRSKSQDFTSSISFTLAIALPEFGGGLNSWDLNYDQTQVQKTQINQLIETRTPTFHPYRIGTLIIHSGHRLHQAAPGINIQPTDERITIQGHGLFECGSWQIYW